MNITDFKRIITSFADRPSDLEFDKGQLLTEIRGELIQAKITTKNDVLFVEENGIEEPAMSWIKNRIACLPQLASRIIDYIPFDKNFVNTHGKLLDELEYDPNEIEQNVCNTNDKLIEILGRKIPGTSSIVYLTSDAGEGKTTLINHLAHKQATNFKEKKSDWLLLPVPLGGRPFLRFDDIVIASIVNNLRFRYFYYDSFIELVRLGLIVPAFDGFEEMFMQSSTGEALSATGELINKLNSSGSMLIAARKAYFDYKSFSSQAKLLDNISSSVSFARMSIQRWTKVQFIEYANKKGVSNSEEIYNLVSDKLKNTSHPILTRPVLVKQLIEVFNGLGNVSDLVTKLESVNNYFPAFVNAIIEREANLKWIDTSGEPYKPILTVEQHYELLSLIAEEMWVNNSNCLKDSILDLITELYADQNKFNIQTNRQIRERIKQHALIVRDEPNNPVYRFDHEEFFEFFLGIVIGDKVLSNRVQDIKSLLKKSQLPYQTIESIVSEIKSNTKDLLKIKDSLDNVIRGENKLSYAKENAGNLVLRILSNEMTSPITIDAYEFPINSLYTIKIENITFNESHFQSTSLNSSYFTNCKFINCQFDRLEINNSTTFKNVEFIDCEITTIFDTHKEKGVYDKFSINLLLKNRNATLTTSSENDSPIIEFPIIEDEDLELTEKALRRFIRQNTPINDGIFKLRLGNSADHFFKKILPDLLKHNILVELDYIGQGRQRRFKLGVTFERIENALNSCKGCYESFLEEFEE
jgi:hypothetical protein